MARPRFSVLRAIFRLGIAEAIAYRTALFIWILTSCFPLIALAMWSGIAGESSVGAYTQKDFVGYFVAAFLVRQLTSCWVVWDLERQIASGDLSTLLLRPVHPLLHHLVTNLAALPVRLVLAVPLGFGVLWMAGGASIEANTYSWLLVVPALIGAWLINFSAQVIIGCLAFWWTRTSALFEVWLGLFVVLSGYVVPIRLMPEAVVAVLDLLPFHASLGFIVELLLGELSLDAALLGLALQWGWVVVLGLLARLAWRRGLRVYGAVGT